VLSKVVAKAEDRATIKRQARVCYHKQCEMSGPALRERERGGGGGTSNRNVTSKTYSEDKNCKQEGW
jgi:hypothetical protein